MNKIKFAIILVCVMISSAASAEELIFKGKKTEFAIFSVSPSDLANQPSVSRALIRYKEYQEASRKLTSAVQVDSLYEKFVRNGNGSKKTLDENYKQRLIKVSQLSNKVSTVVKALVLKDNPEYVFFFAKIPNRTPERLGVAGLKEIGGQFYITEDFTEVVPVLVPIAQSQLNIQDAQKRIYESEKFEANRKR